MIFRLASGSYAVDIATVHEILPMQDIVHMPDAPDSVEGIISLRDKVCPVVELRKSLGVTATEATDESRIVIAEVNGKDVGAIVDGVTYVPRITSDCIAPASTVTAEADALAIKGIANLNGRLIILIDLRKVLSQEDQINLQETEEAEA